MTMIFPPVQEPFSCSRISNLIEFKLMSYPVEDDVGCRYILRVSKYPGKSSRTSSDDLILVLQGQSYHVVLQVLKVRLTISTQGVTVGIYHPRMKVNGIFILIKLAYLT